MRHGPRPAKIREWSRRLARFHASSATVADFCRSESISPASLYQWKKKLAALDQNESDITQDSGIPQHAAPSDFRSAEELPRKQPSLSSPKKPSNPAFATVQLVDGRAGSPTGLRVQLPRRHPYLRPSRLGHR